MKFYPFIKNIITLFLVMFGFSCTISAQQKNPLLDVVGKPYSEYHDTYMSVVSSLLHKDSLSRVELTQLFNEAATIDNTEEWSFINRMIGYIVRFYESRGGGYTWLSDYTAENYSEDMLDLATHAGEKGFGLIKVWGLYNAAEGYRVFAHNYELSFGCYIEAVSELENITTKEFPLRPHIYNQLAALYYTFREYDEAMIYYNKIINDPYGRDNYYNSYYPAINGLGLCYRYGNEDYERSDSCFMQILEQTKSNEADGKVWDGIAGGNIGYNYYLRGDFDTALSWLIPAIEKITRSNDFSFLSLRSINVADIYLRKGDPNSAEKYINIALDYYNRTRIPKKDSHLYDVLARYYTFIGDNQMANSYLDSTLLAKDEENEAFSGLVLRRVEQQLRVADQKIYDQQLNAEQTKSLIYMRITIIVTIALILIFILLALTLLFYRRKRNAYQELVRRSQSWAGMEIQKESALNDTENEYNLTDSENITTESVNISEENEKLIMTDLNHLMQAEKLYRKPDLTLPEVADRLSTNRTYLSKIINTTKKKSFTSYVNEFRIKDAIILLSDPKNSKYSIDYIAEEVGFTNRTTFSQVFKKITGITPTNFKSNNGIN